MRQALAYAALAGTSFVGGVVLLVGVLLVAAGFWALGWKKRPRHLPLGPACKICGTRLRFGETECPWCDVGVREN